MTDDFKATFRKVQAKDRRKAPVWRGPEEDGVTFSLLSRFLVCRERFRLLVVEGLKPTEQFNHRIEYGQMWHVCEEAVAAGTPKVRRWETDLLEYAKGLAKKYPLQQEQVNHWYQVCKRQFPSYLEFWGGHLDSPNDTPLLAEQVFDVPYRLPSGRTVRLRGKWDSVKLRKFRGKSSVWLQENKTKGEIDEQQIKRQLTFDLQTMLYLVALVATQETPVIANSSSGMCPSLRQPIAGVVYNVVRRPLSGGKGSIVRHKPSRLNPHGESEADYYERAASYWREEPSAYFMRWDVGVGPSDVARFRRECLDPILEQLYDWWDYTAVSAEPHVAKMVGQREWCLHWRHPYGVRNVLDEGGHADLDSYLESGSEAGLQRTDNLFPELT